MHDKLEIDACSDVAALKELLFGDATITRQQTDSEGNGVVDSDDNPEPTPER